MDHFSLWAWFDFRLFCFFLFGIWIRKTLFGLVVLFFLVESISTNQSHSSLFCFLYFITGTLQNVGKGVCLDLSVYVKHLENYLNRK